MDASRGARLAENQRRFRSVNERLASDIRDLTGDGERTAFVCECSRVECREAVELTGPEYSGVRADERRFAIVPGHDEPDIERVVERAERYAVVEKLE